MENSVITKVLSNPILNDESMTLGYRRYSVLPQRVVRNLGIAHVEKTGKLDFVDHIKNAFQNMTDQEFKNYLRLL